MGKFTFRLVLGLVMVFFSRLKKGALKVCEHSTKQKNPILCVDPLLETNVLSLFLLTYTHLDSQQNTSPCKEGRHESASYPDTSDLYLHIPWNCSDTITQ